MRHHYFREVAFAFFFSGGGFDIVRRDGDDDVVGNATVDPDLRLVKVVEFESSSKTFESGVKMYFNKDANLRIQ